VEDLSEGGIGIQSWRQVPAGTFARVYICAEDTFYKADVQVLYATQTPSGFKIGCKFASSDGADAPASNPGGP
jgi:hypothetical protein